MTHPCFLDLRYYEYCQVISHYYANAKINALNKLK